MTTAIAKTKAPTHRGDINISEPEALIFWATQFEISEDEIVEAIQQVGGGPDAIKTYFEKWKFAAVHATESPHAR